MRIYICILCIQIIYIYNTITASVRGGRVLLTERLLPRIAPLASNCSTGNCLSDFNKRISSNNFN